MNIYKRFEIRVAGFGGQGVVTVGKILGTAFTVFEGENSVNSQSYGPESRGGACKSEVIVSDGEINYPHVRRADIFIALSQLALDTYISDLREGGILIVDPNSVKNVPERGKYDVYEVSTTEIAHEVGGVKFQNCVALGALYPFIKDLIKETSLRRAISESVPPKTLKVNMTAFERGKRYIKEHYVIKRT